MVGAIIKDGVCVNVAVFADKETMLSFDAVEIPTGYGIGDIFDGVSWKKKEINLPEPSIEEQIANLKMQLAATDYLCLKWAEGHITDEEYAPIKAERQALRDRINELEQQLEQH